MEANPEGASDYRRLQHTRFCMRQTDEHPSYQCSFRSELAKFGCEPIVGDPRRRLHRLFPMKGLSMLTLANIVTALQYALRK